MTSRAYLVTGTDTGIGKTTVTCSASAALAARDLRVGVVKPVETGCEPDVSGSLSPADAIRLKFFSGCREPLETICPYRFLAPLAPGAAAKREGRTIDVASLGETAAGVIARHDVTFVEGAGGLLVPVRGRLTFADLARDWQLPLLVVIGNRLGAVNHAQLTIAHARAVGLRVAGYVVNTLAAERDLAMETNADLLAELLGPSLGTMPWLGPVECTAADRSRLAAVAEAALNLDAI